MQAGSQPIVGILTQLALLESCEICSTGPFANEVKMRQKADERYLEQIIREGF